jgi:hypothetical protein
MLADIFSGTFYLIGTDMLFPFLYIETEPFLNTIDSVQLTEKRNAINFFNPAVPGRAGFYGGSTACLA